MNSYFLTLTVFVALFFPAVDARAVGANMPSLKKRFLGGAGGGLGLASGITGQLGNSLSGIPGAGEALSATSKGLGAGSQAAGGGY